MQNERGRSLRQPCDEKREMQDARWSFVQERDARQKDFKGHSREKAGAGIFKGNESSSEADKGGAK